MLSNSVCMTRLRVTLKDPNAVDYETLGDVQGVLGTATRGRNGLEVVFGPRVIDGIYHAFIALTGISASAEDLFPMSRQSTNMRVQIRTSKRQAQINPSTDVPLINDHEMSLLEDLFGRRDDEDEPAQSVSLRLLVVNGPNINMIGLSTPDDESDDFPALLDLCKSTAEQAGFIRCDCFQSNHEGDLVDMVQDTYETFDAIVINPGAYGSSLALRDALRAVSIPAIEVHLHALDDCDSVGSVCLNSICGFGIDGYRRAINEIAQHLL